MSKTVQFSIVGNGFIANKHRTFITANPEAELRSTVDPRTEADHSDLDAFIAEDAGRSDVVCITSPNHLHVPQAEKLLRNGYHVIVEKPLGLDSSKASKLRQTETESGRRVFVVMQNRYSPVSAWLKEVVDGDLLGQIYHVQVNCYWNRGAAYYGKNDWHGDRLKDGGSLFTQFSHFVDLLYWVFGTFDAVGGRLANYNHGGITEFADSGFIDLRFASGMDGQFNFTTSCFSRNLESAVTILAEKATIKLGGQYMERIIHCDGEGPFPDLAPEVPVEGPYSGNAANHRFVIQNAVDHVLRGVAVDTPLDQGLEVIRIIERMYAIEQRQR